MRLRIEFLFHLCSEVCFVKNEMELMSLLMKLMEIKKTENFEILRNLPSLLPSFPVSERNSASKIYSTLCVTRFTF